MKTCLLLALSLALTAHSQPVAATPAPGPPALVAPTTRACDGDAVRLAVLTTRYDCASHTFTLLPTPPAAVAQAGGLVREYAILPSRWVRVPYQVRPRPELVRVPLIYRGYMKRAYGRGWHPDFTYLVTPAYRAFIYYAVAFDQAGPTS